MKLTNHPSIKHHLKTLKSQWETQRMVSDLWIDLFKHASPLTDQDEINAFIDETGLSLEASFSSLLLQSIDLSDLSKKTQRDLTKQVQTSIRFQSLQAYQTNPYLKAVKPNEKTQGSWQLCYSTYHPYQPFLLGDIAMRETPFFSEQTPVGFDTQPFSYLEIKQHDSTWMSVTPFEIETMKKPLALLEGHVVTLGLGLGYIAFMASIKPNVKSVTIVEKDEKVISLFKNNIFPFFPYPEKITIVHQDAFDYLKRPQPNIDHLFVDIYQTADDGLPLYLTIKGYESLWTNTTFSYWLEQSILGKYRRYMMFYLFELDRTNNEIDMSNDEEDVENFLKQLHVMTKDTVLNSPEDVNQWLSLTSLMSLLSKHIDNLKSL
jgi:hypothetical protein